jgi:putative oxidoreductase
MSVATQYPFISLRHALVTLRVVLAVLFMAHAAMRLVNNTIAGFGAFLEREGWPFGVAIVWCITLYELIGGSLMALGWRVRWMASGLAFIAFMGIVIVHWNLGWFVGEHGTGGVEYSIALLAGLLVVAAADRASR